MPADQLKDEFKTAVERYAEELPAAGLSPVTVSTYVYRAHRFLEWVASHEPISAGPRRWPTYLSAYGQYLIRLDAAPTTVATYLDGARRFVHWLEGAYEPRTPQRTAGDAVVTRVPPSAPAATVDLPSLLAARDRYRQIEPRDLFYRAAIDLIGRARRGSDAPLSLGEAVAVLLYTWNQAFYRYHPATSDHVDRLEATIARHREALNRWGTTRLRPDTLGNSTDIAATFTDFEDLLGPVGAAKGLHLLAPTFFPIWDRAIAAAYRCGLGKRGTNAPRYVRFMHATAEQCARLEHGSDAPRDVVKALDEWNYVMFTRKDA